MHKNLILEHASISSPCTNVQTAGFYALQAVHRILYLVNNSPKFLA